MMRDDESQPSAGRKGARLQWGVKVPLRDGTRLSALLYLPSEAGGQAPAIFTLTPYIAQTWHDHALYFAEQGYVFLSIDVRGRGNSEGEFRPLINEADDSFDVVEWLAKQPYCNGQVAMWGGSYSGYTQWAAASKHPPHLASIAPVASPYLAVDFPLRGNIGKPYWMKWLTLVWGRTSQDRLFWNNDRFWSDAFRHWYESGAPFRELDSLLGNPSPTFQEWLDHPVQSSYWDRYNPTAEQYAGMTQPVLTITGCCDGDQAGALMHYRLHLQHAAEDVRARHYLVIGPWDHAGTREPKLEFCGLKVGPESLVDLRQLHVQWYAWTMQGGPKPAFLRKRVAYYVMGADRWRYADSLDEITARTEPLYLQSRSNPTDVFSSGSLLSEPPKQSEPDWYEYDPRDVSLAEIECNVDPETRSDQRMVLASAGRHLVYHSAPFAADAEISGFFKLSLWLQIDQPDTDFRASVYEVALDGSSILLTTEAMRARYRQGLRESQLIQRPEPLRYDFQRFMFVSRLVRKRHRLRLIVGPINSMYMQKNYNAGGVVAEESMADARPVVVKLFHDASHPSALYVPFAQPEA